MRAFQAATIASLVSVVISQQPKWNQTWQLNLSTIVMACNYSAALDPAAVPSYHIVDVDWSSGKELWAKAHPMNAEESIEQQALAVASAQPGRRVFVYRNAIKALPWFSTVRAKVTNRSYSAWFVPFGPPTVNASKWHVPDCDANYEPPLCSSLYHDQVQTPSYPGYCEAPACDCGGVPCGEYVFDFRAANVSVGGQTFVSWFIEEYFFGPTGLGNAAIAGLYVDDFWSVTGGPSEMDAHAVADMGLSSAEVADMTAAYKWVLAQATAVVEARAKWMWSEFLNNDPFQSANGGCPQPWVKNETCASDLRGLCGAVAPQTRTLLYGFSPGCPSLNPEHPASPLHDVVNFQLIRGPYAVIGSGWQGCAPSQQYAFPAELNYDFGAPLGNCTETAPGVFTREFSRASVQMACATWTPTISWRQS